MTILTRDLRVGLANAEFWHKYGSDSIGIVQSKFLLESDHAIFVATLKPVDSNTRSDADSIFLSDDYGLYRVTVRDAQIANRASQFLRVYEDQTEYFLLKIVYSRSLNIGIGNIEITDDILQMDLEVSQSA